MEKKYWKRVLWSDESKCNLKDEGNLKVRRPKGKRLNPIYTSGMVKHGGGKDAMVLGFFLVLVVGPIHRINGVMDRFAYRDILKEIMVPHADNNMPLL